MTFRLGMPSSSASLIAGSNVLGSSLVSSLTDRSAVGPRLVLTSFTFEMVTTCSRCRLVSSMCLLVVRWYVSSCLVGRDSSVGGASRVVDVVLGVAAKVVGEVGPPILCRLVPG